MSTLRDQTKGSTDGATTVYALAQITIHDPARYRRYVRGFRDVLVRFGGRLLAADEAPEVLEGSWSHDKVILLSFDDADSFWAWARSDAYQEISKDRVAATEGSVILVHGIGRAVGAAPA